MPFVTDVPPDTVVVTASRLAEPPAQTAASVTVIDEDVISRLAPPLLPDLIRLTPSAAVSTSGPAGSLTQVRIRGAEANHTLLFVDGIRANDPAAGNEPRFELLNADLASRVEVVRGPQSALWGSEAIGGVIAVTGAGANTAPQALAEAGSSGFGRAAGRVGLGSADGYLNVGLALQGANGIDSFDGTGDSDGYRNRAARLAGGWRVTPKLRLAATGFTVRGRSEFDGYNPLTFLRDDTLDETRNRLHAARIAADWGSQEGIYLTAAGSMLRSRNDNLLDDERVNDTRARRRTVGIEGGTAIGRHHIVIALEDERERFAATDVVYGGATAQRRGRSHRSVTTEFKSDFRVLRANVAIRHDAFSRFRDATTLRASATVPVSATIDFAATYGEGIAQPTFFDLYGFFPGSFVGNPDLKPERSRGGEVALRYRSDKADAAITLYRQTLRDEIVGTFDPGSFLSSTANGDGRSRRRGVEFEAGYRWGEVLRISGNYAYLDASEPAVASGSLREQRRPRHSGALFVDGLSGPLTYGASIAYVGARDDTDFDRFPAERLRLPAYTLVGGRVGWRVAPDLEVSVRAANLLDKRYVDVIGYRTEGRSVHVGLRYLPGR